MVNGPSPGPATSGPGPGQQLPAHPIQLADVAPPEAAQESIGHQVVVIEGDLDAVGVVAW